jgi:twitching motility protein PilU
MRELALEVMLNSPLVGDLIFKAEIAVIKEVMKQSRELGMQTFDQALFDLYGEDRVGYEDALRNADSVNDLRLKIKLNGRRGVRDLHKGTEHLNLV